MTSKIKFSPLLTCLILLQSAFLTAQSVVTDNEMDKKYTPNENSVFNNLHKKNDNSSSSAEITFENAVKFCPTMLFRQKIFFVYERKIFDGLSISGGIGKAFGNDLFQALAPLTNSIYVPNNTDISASDMLTESVFSGSGPMLFAGLKLYYSGNAFEGGFIEFNYRRERMDYELNSTVNEYKVSGLNTVSFKTDGFSFGYGFSGTSGKKNNMTHEIYMNTGVKLVKYTRFELFHIGPTNNSYDFVYRKTEDVLTYRIVPTFNIGYIFGFGF